jgi:glucose-1-phosphate adenylyltransferase
MDGVRIGRRAVVRNAILDKNVVIGEGVEIGVSKDDDRERGFVVSDNGVTVLGKGQEVMK